jgi:CopA family copper-resistance protein
MKRVSFHSMAASFSRRRFVQRLATGGLLAGLPAWASARPAKQEFPDAPALRGTDFELVIDAATVSPTGATRAATLVNGQLPAPTLYWREGDTVTLRVSNRLPVTSSIHWHGLLLPFQMDGVPGFSYDGIAPGESFVYRFPVRQSGTYWYHSHSRFQEQTGLYGAIVIAPRGGERHTADRDHVLVLSDWTDEDPEHIYAHLKKHSDYYNYRQPTAKGFLADVKGMGLKSALDKRRMWNQMRMSPTDFSDVTGATYTYLVNGAAPADNWSMPFKPGEKVRLRIVNASSSTFFDLRIPGLKLTVVAADGQDIEPVSVDEFRLAPAETYDVIVAPTEDRAYTVFAQSIDRSGFARATLAPRAGMVADVPKLDLPQPLTMTDMMGAMGSMGGMKGMGSATHDMAGMSGGEMDHGSMKGMASEAPHPATPLARHARTEYGPGVDMRVDMPRTGLDDPGINLRHNGRRVLTYADMKTLGGPLDPRPPGRDIELHLTGNMERFMWSFDGVKFSEARPIHLRYGERVRVILSNDTMMNHPIHLHGMFSELESPDGQFQVRKHTVNVQPAQRVSFLVSADAPGRWAFHCHLLYHMEAGMFREVFVS